MDKLTSILCGTVVALVALNGLAILTSAHELFAEDEKLAGRIVGVTMERGFRESQAPKPPKFTHVLEMRRVAP